MRMIRLAVTAALVLCFIVVVFGAYVRKTDAGLGCPDWPGCYGHVTPLGAAESPAAQAEFPHRPLNVQKAWHEMIHRYLAGTLGLIIVLITALSLGTREGRRVIGSGYGIFLTVIVLVQAVLGMLTVTWQLKPLIVTSHLLFGLTTLALLWWLWLSLPRHAWGGVARPVTDLGWSPRQVRTAYRLTLLALVVLAFQIALGGWTSSNYAALACPDFPTCQGAWFPHADFRDAFVLWRGLSIDYEGGILNNPARVAIHLTHRLGAIVATIALLTAALFVLRRSGSSSARWRAWAVIAALALQLAIGITMVKEAFPLSLATAHTAGAAVLLMATLALLQRLGHAR